MALFLTYNILAFMTQPFSGMLADRTNGSQRLLLGSTTILLLAVTTAACLATFGVPEAGLLAVAVMLGIGNSLFHAWGGRIVACATANDTRALGIFVATGALGLAVGIVGSSWTLLAIMLIAMCALTFPSILPVTKTTTTSRNNQERFSEKTATQCLILSILLLYVMFRALAGEALGSYVTKSHSVMQTLAATAATGKVLGGWMAHHGRRLTLLLVATAGTMVCLLWHNSGMPVALAGIFLINCTMPVTLYWANASLPGREGLAFGLLAAALVPGYLLAYIV